MESRKRTAAETHYEFYLGIESDFLTASRYIEFSDDHRNVHSHFFSHMLTTAGAEFESVSKAIAVAAEKPEPLNILDIKKLYLPVKTASDSLRLGTLKGDIEVTPFSDWKNETQLTWWKAYNNIKHSRHTHAHDGSLLNALHALGSLYFANLVLYSTEYGPPYKPNNQSNFFLLHKFKDEEKLFRGDNQPRHFDFLNLGKNHFQRRVEDLLNVSTQDDTVH